MLTKGQTPPKKGKGSRLTAKMENFVDEYFVDSNASQAVLRAGYKTRNPHKMAAKLMNHPLVEEEIKKRKEERRTETEIERDYLLTKLVDVIDSTSEKTADRLRAIELAGKAIALWKERQEISGPDGESIKMEQKTQENVQSFKSKLDRLAKRAGTSDVAEFPKPEGDGSS